MSQQESTQPTAPKPSTLSLDTWAVVIALTLTLLVKLDVIHRVPW